MATTDLLGGGGATLPAKKVGPAPPNPLQPQGGAVNANLAPPAVVAPGGAQNNGGEMPWEMFQGSLLPENQQNLNQYMTDWANAGGGRGVKNAQGQDMAYGDVVNYLKSQGRDTSMLPGNALPNAPTNPFAGLVDQYNQIYKDTSANVGSIYDQLIGQLGANKNQFNTETGAIDSLLNNAYSGSANDINNKGAELGGQLSTLAQQMGLQNSSLGTPSKNFAEELARIQALNSANQASSESTMAVRKGTLGDLLLADQSAGQQQKAASLATLANSALNRFGLSDPNDLYSKYLTDQGTVQQQNAQFNLAQLQAQAALKGATGGSGKSSGGRKSSSGSKSSSGTPAAGALVDPYQVYTQYLQDNGVTPDTMVVASQIQKKLQGGDNAVGRKLGVNPI